MAGRRLECAATGHRFTRRQVVVRLGRARCVQVRTPVGPSTWPVLVVVVVDARVAGVAPVASARIRVVGVPVVGVAVVPWLVARPGATSFVVAVVARVAVAVVLLATVRGGSAPGVR